MKDVTDCHLEPRTPYVAVSAVKENHVHDLLWTQRKGRTRLLRCKQSRFFCGMLLVEVATLLLAKLHTHDDTGPGGRTRTRGRGTLYVGLGGGDGVRANLLVLNVV